MKRLRTVQKEPAVSTTCRNLIVLTLSSLLFIILFFAAERAEATPLFAMQAAERCDTCHEMPDRSDPKWVEENYKISERKCRLSCNSCHVNPSGGMLRNDTGFYFGTKTLPWKKGLPERIAPYLEKIKTEWFTIGGDARFLLLAKEDREKTPYSSRCRATFISGLACLII